ncbi:MAG: hypothetical protein Q9M39_03735 [Sulfurovum sp.]|nr:hypothetical protein [Sulfurovum sp.]
MRNRLSILIFIFFITFLNAKECHQTLKFDDMHYLKTTFEGNTKKETKVIQEKLYINHIEGKGDKYSIFWFGDSNTTKNDVNIESYNAPFLVEYKDINGSYLIDKLHILSKDKEIEKLLWAKINILQFASTEGIHHFKNFTGYIEAEQNLLKKDYNIKRLSSFVNNRANQNVKFEDSNIIITLLENSCKIWKSLTLKENLKSTSIKMKIDVEDERILNLNNVENDLPKDHWFYKLTIDMKSWGFKQKENMISLSTAQSIFQKKQSEMLGLLGDTLAFGEWVKNNMEFLKHLSLLLENNTLNDNVSKKLFAKLGYLNSVDTTGILAQVTLNKNIIEKERFRGVMSLKNTSAPLNDDLLEELLDYGLSSDNDNMIQSMTGMIVGGLAKERIKRVPEQAERIIDSIINTIDTKENKTVALAAAGNLGEMAPNNLVETVDNILMNIDDADTRAKSANVISKIQKSTLSTTDFKELIVNETNTMTKTSLINASASATDFQNNTEFNSILLKISKISDYTKNEIAAINTLKKTNYGKTKEERRVIRKMMIGVTDSQKLKALKELYRK